MYIEMAFCCLTAVTKTLTVLCFFIMRMTEGSMNVRLARAAEERRNVSADVVFLDNTEKNIIKYDYS